MPQLAKVESTGVGSDGVAIESVVLSELTDGFKDACEVDRYLAPCVDATPLAGDTVACVETTDETGDLASVGYSVESLTEPGEGRFFSRDAATKETAAHLWVRADGSLLLQAGVNVPGVDCSVGIFPDGSLTLANNFGSIQVLQDGTVVINGVAFSPTGAVTGVSSLAVSGAITASSVAASGAVTSGLVNLSSHTHLVQALPSAPPVPPVPTAPPNPG